MSLDTVFEVMADQRRRFALYTLLDAAADTVSLEDLIEDVATLEAARAGDGLARERYVAIASDLFHWQLEVLTEVGIVEYDERSQVVRYHSEPLVEEWVQRAKTEELSSR